MSLLIFYRQITSANALSSTQAYYTTEASIEDALLKLYNNPQMSSMSYTFNVGSTTANVTIPDIIGGSRAIVSQGNAFGISRKIQTTYSIDSQVVSFYYGAQIDAGGLIMNNGSRIQGNVFSNGNISGGSGTIDNNVIVAGNGHSIKDVYVVGNVQAYSCLSATSVQNLTYVSPGGSNTCTVRGTTSFQSGEIATQPLPISQIQINGWKSEATAGGESGSVTVSGIQSLGPKKIIGDLIINNNATLKIMGTIYVTGQISLGNGATMKLDISYNSLGGVILTDGKISMGNDSNALGSGQAGSYLLALSTNSAIDAINLNNGVVGSVFYTSLGTIILNNNVQVKEITGYRIDLQNNAIVQYESGLANAFFSSGPGGAWKVTSWGEQ